MDYFVTLSPCNDSEWKNFDRRKLKGTLSPRNDSEFLQQSNDVKLKIWFDIVLVEQSKNSSLVMFITIFVIVKIFKTKSDKRS